jgi:hypothetical protein
MEPDATAATDEAPEAEPKPKRSRKKQDDA